MRWLPLSALILCISCTAPTSYQALRDPPGYVDHVVEDVTAMLEGMANAHSAERVVLRDPNFRSSRQPKVD
jgi:hypothetical protein